MSPFDTYLESIGQQITIKDEDREIYTKDFDIIRDYVLKVMREDPVFDKLFQGPSLFGSYANNVRIKKPSEFDVLIKLSFPFARYLIVERNKYRPGFVLLSCKDVVGKIDQHENLNDIYNQLLKMCKGDDWYLKRKSLKYWLHNILTFGLRKNGYRVIGHLNDVYELKYSRRGVAHRIFAKSEQRSISVDFVPAVLIGQIPWVKKIKNPKFMWMYNRWYAIPKPTIGDDPENTGVLTFMLCNPKAEHNLLLKKQNLKVVYRLIKSIRDKYELKRFKSYFITTLFLWQISKTKNKYWKQPTSVILVDMLNIICIRLENGNLPFFWDPKYNILDILSQEEIEEYSKAFGSAYTTLKTYGHQQLLSFVKCLSHFEVN